MEWNKAFSHLFGKKYIIIPNVKTTSHTGLTRIAGVDGGEITHASKISGMEWNKLISHVEVLEEKIKILEGNHD